LVMLRLAAVLLLLVMYGSGGAPSVMCQLAAALVLLVMFRAVITLLVLWVFSVA
jgi:hypothetical protein